MEKRYIITATNKLLQKTRKKIKHISNMAIDYVKEFRKQRLRGDIEKILHSMRMISYTVETMTLFVNDQTYNYIVELESAIKKSKIYKQEVKKLFNEMSKEIKRYNSRIYGLYKDNMIEIADLTQLMEDELTPCINELSDTIHSIVSKRNFPEEQSRIITILTVISSLAASSDRLISSGYEMIKDVSVIPHMENPFLFMSISRIASLSVKLSDKITNGEIQLDDEEYKSVSKIMDMLLMKMSDEDLVDKIVQLSQEKEEKK